VRNLRVPDDIWRAAQEKAKAEGRTLTDVIVAYLKRYVAAPPRRGADGEHTPGTHDGGSVQDSMGAVGTEKGSSE
jgi:hypothetical protein